MRAMSLDAVGVPWMASESAGGVASRIKALRAARIKARVVLPSTQSDLKDGENDATAPGHAVKPRSSPLARLRLDQEALRHGKPSECAQTCAG